MREGNNGQVLKMSKHYRSEQKESVHYLLTSKKRIIQNTLNLCLIKGTLVETSDKVALICQDKKMHWQMCW